MFCVAVSQTSTDPFSEFAMLEDLKDLAELVSIRHGYDKLWKSIFDFLYDESPSELVQTNWYHKYLLLMPQEAVAEVMNLFRKTVHFQTYPNTEINLHQEVVNSFDQLWNYYYESPLLGLDDKGWILASLLMITWDLEVFGIECQRSFLEKWCDILNYPKEDRKKVAVHAMMCLAWFREDDFTMMMELRDVKQRIYEEGTEFLKLNGSEIEQRAWEKFIKEDRRFAQLVS